MTIYYGSSVYSQVHHYATRVSDQAQCMSTWKCPHIYSAMCLHTPDFNRVLYRTELERVRMIEGLWLGRKTSHMNGRQLAVWLSGDSKAEQC